MLRVVGRVFHHWASAATCRARVGVARLAGVMSGIALTARLLADSPVKACDARWCARRVGWWGSSGLLYQGPRLVAATFGMLV